MVKFFRSVLLHFFAIIVAMGLFCFFGFIFLAIISAGFQKEAAAIPAKAVLVVSLDMEVFDSPDNSDPLKAAVSEIQGENIRRMPLRQVLVALERAKDDERIKGVLLISNFSRRGGMANTTATLSELRGKLLELRAAGKTIFAYSHTEGLGELYLKSIADQHWMDPYGMIDHRGLAAQIAYLGGAFERFGIEYQVVRAGKFKSAGEPYTESKMSDETRESLGELLGDLWLTFRQGIAEETSLSPQELDDLASTNPLLSPQKAIEVGLVDELIRYDEMLETLINFAGYSAEGKTFNQVSLEDYIADANGPISIMHDLGGSEIAVVYAEGIIVDGLGDAEVIGGERFARIFRRLRQDDDVKAIVLRVNSPGGSATASEAIAREVELTNVKKPVVVSMGGYAASGGYYIAAPADTIFAQPTTVTGSIGVVAMLPNIEEATGRFDIHFETVQTNPHGTLWSLFDSREEGEIAMFQEHVDYTYGAFLARVAAGRKMPLEAVRRIAEGREWSGTDALDNGLVDRLGGLEDAIEYAANLTGLGNSFTIRDLPRARTLEQAIAEAFSPDSPFSSRFKFPVDAFINEVAPLGEQWSFLQNLNDRYHLYSYEPARISW